MKKHIAIITLVSLLFLTSANALEVADDFSSSRDYLTAGTAGTIWDGFVGLGATETVDAMNSNTDRSGQLFLQSTGGYWQPDASETLGPFLYRNVSGDFVATIHVTDYEGSIGNEIQHNNGGLMARAYKDPDQAGTGEDWVSIDYFPIWTCGNVVRQCDDHVRTEPCKNTDAFDSDTYLRLEKSGSSFHFSTSPDGVTFTPMSCSSLTRTDLTGITLQVGIMQSTYSANQGYVAFDDFVLDETTIIDEDPPLPDPAQWGQQPVAISAYAVTMVAQTGSDISSPIQYNFQETSGNPGGSDSGWQTSSTYTDYGLSPETQYSYRVQMRDSIGNTGGFSSTLSDTTLEEGAAVHIEDTFDVTWDYLASGTAGTIWDGFVGLDATETVDVLDASTTNAGKLYIQSTGAFWEGSFDPKGPFLYTNVDGDFSATVYIEDALTAQWNCAGLMARVPNLADAGAGEDFESVEYFPQITTNLFRSIDNGTEAETTTGGLLRYLRLRRVGIVFYHEVSSDGVSWDLMAGSPSIRPDLAGLQLQVGLHQSNYNSNTCYAVFEDFQLDIESPNPYSANPSPEDDDIQIAVNATLTWEPGFWADSHDIYFGTDFNDVNDADDTWPLGGIYKGNVPFETLSYTLLALQENNRYYWRIDEVGASEIWKGDVWTFKTFTNVLDDFEDYMDSTELDLTWAVEGGASASLSTSQHHKSTKAMQLDYDNTSSYYSLAVMNFPSTVDWASQGAKSISLYFKGSPTNPADKLSVILTDGDWISGYAIVEYDGDPNNLKKPYWQRWDIELDEFVQQYPDFRLSSVTGINIVLGDITAQAYGGTGTIYIDDIYLNAAKCLDKNKPIADLDGDCDVDANDLKLIALSWLDETGPADLIGDDSIDFLDYAALAQKWLGQYNSWPLDLDPDEFLDMIPYYDVDIQGGLWAERIETDRTVTIPHNLSKLESEGRVDNFRKAAGMMSGGFEGLWFNDSDVYKVLEAVAYSLRLHPDTALEATADNLIDIVEQAQWSDGYLNTYYSLEKQPEDRWTYVSHDHEHYCAGHLFEGAVAYYETTGKPKLLNVSMDFFEHINDTFGPGKNMYPPGHQEIELAMMRMYHLLGDQRYLDLTKFFTDQRGNAAGHDLYGTYSQDHVPFVDQENGVGHAVRACYFFEGAADIARVNHDQAYMNSLIKVWDNIVACKTYITGGLGQPGGPEGFTVDYDLGNNSYCETCASIAFSNWNHKMFLLTGDAKYFDMAERSMHNNILSGLSLSGDHFFYPNKLETGGETRPDWYACACCPPNLARYIMSIGQKAYAQQANDLYVNMYVDGEVDVSLDDVDVSLDVETNYPWDGNINITIDPEITSEFALYLRIPGWARNIPMPGNLYSYVTTSTAQPTLTVNGSSIPVDVKKGFVKIQRTWSTGDNVNLVLPMPVRRVISHPSVAADAGKVVIQRGPVVYCAEGIDNGGSTNITIPDSLVFTPTFEPGTLNGVTVLRSTSPNITLIPYYTWANRGSTPMKVWLDRQE